MAWRKVVGVMKTGHEIMTCAHFRGSLVFNCKAESIAKETFDKARDGIYLHRRRYNARLNTPQHFTSVGSLRCRMRTMEASILLTFFSLPAPAGR